MSRTSHPSMEKMKLTRLKSRGRLFPKGGGADAARPTVAPPSTTPSPPSGPMTRARAKLLQAKVNSLLSTCDFGLPLDGLLLHATTLCILSYEATSPHQASKDQEKTLLEHCTPKSLVLYTGVSGPSSGPAPGTKPGIVR